MYPGKRLFDVTGSLVGVLVFSPVWVVTIGLIALLDGRPVFFTQRRLGVNKSEFTMYKFRTMTTDGAITRTGRWLRATGIDESVQFLRVLKGDMSIVGPRPFIESDLEKLGWDSRRLDWRWSIKPGITGLAQINERWASKWSLAWDRYYFRQASMLTDIRSVGITVVINIIGKRIFGACMVNTGNDRSTKT